MTQIYILFNERYTSFDFDTSQFMKQNDFSTQGEIKGGLKAGKWTEYSFDSWTFIESQGADFNIENTSTMIEFTLLKAEGNYKNGKRDGSWTLYETDLRRLNPTWIRTGSVIYNNLAISRKIDDKTLQVSIDWVFG